MSVSTSSQVGQRFIEQEYVGFAHQRLCKEYPLKLSAGEDAERTVRKLGRADTFERQDGRVTVAVGERVEAPPVPRESEAYELQALHVRVAVYRMTLGDVADSGIPSTGRLVEYL